MIYTVRACRKAIGSAAATLAMVAGVLACAAAARTAAAPAAANAGELATGPAATGDSYTLDKCAVTGQKLGAMGAPVIYNFKGREVRFCCKGCAGKFEANPANYFKGIDAALVRQQLPYYPLDTCLVTGEKLGAMGDPVNTIYKNRLVRFCCAGCVAKFEKEPAKYIAALDKAVIEKQKPTYPLETCVVTGQKLGSMGDPVEYVVGNRLVRLCCAGCVKQLRQDPLASLAKLDAAAKARQGGAPGTGRAQGAR
jgi:YHS domain-containing protein